MHLNETIKFNRELIKSGNYIHFKSVVKSCLKKVFLWFQLNLCMKFSCVLRPISYIISLNFLLISAIIGIVGCANALKATALILGRVPNVNKTTTAATTTTTSTTVATSDADLLNDEDVSINQRLLLGTRSINNLIV